MRPTTGYCEHFENGIKNELLIIVLIEKLLNIFNHNS